MTGAIKNAVFPIDRQPPCVAAYGVVEGKIHRAAGKVSQTESANSVIKYTVRPRWSGVYRPGDVMSPAGAGCNSEWARRWLARL